MSALISMDLRLRIVGAVERGSSIRRAARRFAVAARRVSRRRRFSGP